MSTIGERVKHIRALHPRGPNKYGQLYKSAQTAQRKFQKVTLYTLFVSDGGSDGEETYLLRNHLFESKKAKRTPAEWSAWFANNLSEVHRTGVLPGMSVRTGKAWSVLKIIGWSGDVRTSSAIIKRKPKHVARRTPRSDRRKPMAATRRKGKRKS